MTDKEVWEYNQKFMIEETTEMMFGSASKPIDHLVSALPMTARDKKIWNAAIEEAAKLADSAGSEPIGEIIMDLKK